MEDTSGLHRGTKVLYGKSILVFEVLYTAIDSGKDSCVMSENKWHLTTVVKFLSLVQINLTIYAR